MSSDLYDVAIIGSGPAALTAGLYASRGNLTTIILGGLEWGGQLMLTTDVENYPGFPKGIMGPEMMELFKEQATRFGAEFRYEQVGEADLRQRPFRLRTDENTYLSRAVIIATGASARWLGLPNEERLRGHGVSSCATCDGFFFKDLDVAVVGGGDTAMEDSLYLSKLARSVTVIHRRAELRASKIMQQRAFAEPKLTFIWNSVVEDVLGDDKVEAVRLRNLQTDAETTLPVSGLFVAIGHTPNTELFRGQIDMDESGYILPRNHTETNIPGVFAAGDCVDHRYRQAIVAAGDGCRAAMDAEKYLATAEGVKAGGAATAQPPR